METQKLASLVLVTLGGAEMSPWQGAGTLRERKRRTQDWAVKPRFHQPICIFA